MHSLKCAVLAIAFLGVVVTLSAEAQPPQNARISQRQVDDPDWMFEMLERIRERYN